MCGRLSSRFLWQTQTHQQGNKGEERAVAASFHDTRLGWLPPTLSRPGGVGLDPQTGLGVCTPVFPSQVVPTGQRCGGLKE